MADELANVEETVPISGEFDGASIAVQIEQLAALSARALRLELAELELLDGVAVAALVSAIRELAARSQRLTLVSSPQLLAHNLYRVGLLSNQKIVLIDTREEEPYG